MMQFLSKIFLPFFPSLNSATRRNVTQRENFAREKKTDVNPFSPPPSSFLKCHVFVCTDVSLSFRVDG